MTVLDILRVETAPLKQQNPYTPCDPLLYYAMSRRQPKAGGPSSSKNPTIASDVHNDSPQDLAAPERQ
jgi:hypothetical protein